MAQISRRFVEKDVEKRMLEIFYVSFSRISNPSVVAKFLDDLLSPTEKIMLAKRLSISYLLLKGYDSTYIEGVLKVSRTTVWSVQKNLQFKGDALRSVLGPISRNSEISTSIDKIDNFLEDLLDFQPKTSWSVTKKEKARKRKLQKKAF